MWFADDTSSDENKGKEPPDEEILISDSDSDPSDNDLSIDHSSDSDQSVTSIELGIEHPSNSDQSVTDDEN
jgi:hypothetical protein